MALPLSRQDYQWIKDIDHEGHLVNVLSCYETKKNKAPKKFVWITNLNITEKIVLLLVMKEVEIDGRLKIKG